MTKVTGLLWQARDRGIELLSRAVTYYFNKDRRKYYDENER